MEEEEREHEERKAQRHAEQSLEMKRQMHGRKCQCEVKPVPTELEYIVEGNVTSTAQRETGISYSLSYAETYSRSLLPAVTLLAFYKRKQKRPKLPGSDGRLSSKPTT